MADPLSQIPGDDGTIVEESTGGVGGSCCVCCVLCGHEKWCCECGMGCDLNGLGCGALRGGGCCAVRFGLACGLCGVWCGVVWGGMDWVGCGLVWRGVGWGVSCGVG